jgi:pyrroloquinoline quinone (PQQ) biosynthesis protein C
VRQAKVDSAEAIGFVVRHADSYAKQQASVAALIRKTEILWHLLDCVAAAQASEPAAAAA